MFSCLGADEIPGEDIFHVDIDTGELQIVGRMQFEIGAQYKLGISAIPRGVLEPRNSTPVEAIRFQVDDIRPQFFESPRYEVDMPESTEINDMYVLQVVWLIKELSIVIK